MAWDSITFPSRISSTVWPDITLLASNKARFHRGLDENQVERLFNTHGFHGKGLLFFLYSKHEANYSQLELL